MHELNCPNCNTPSQFELKDYFHLCPYCSTTFHIDYGTGRKEIFHDHFIVPNQVDAKRIKEIIVEWFKRFHHSPVQAESEFKVTQLTGISIPHWIISVDVHTTWKGYVVRQSANKLDSSPNSRYLVETGTFKRAYRWAVSARKNIHEQWGMLRIHHPREDIQAEWDGFPLDSTFSRGLLGTISPAEENKIQDRIYEAKEPFDFRFANGTKILSTQIDETEAIRRAQRHIDQYHLRLAQVQCDTLIDIQTEFDMAGIQLVHLPVWSGKYIYKPQGFLAHFTKPEEKNLLIDGFGAGVLQGELVLVKSEKMMINAWVSAGATLIMIILAFVLHPAFILVALFTAGVSLISGYLGKKAAMEKIDADLKNDIAKGTLKLHTA